MYVRVLYIIADNSGGEVLPISMFICQIKPATCVCTLNDTRPPTCQSIKNLCNLIPKKFFIPPELPAIQYLIK